MLTTKHRFFVVQDDTGNTYASESLTDAIELLHPDPYTKIAGFIVYAHDAGEARLIRKGAQPVPGSIVNKAQNKALTRIRGTYPAVLMTDE